MSKRCAIAGRRRPIRLRFLAGLSALLLLAGCGFHLQGAIQLPAGVDAVYVAYDNGNYRVGEPPLVDALKRRLRASGKLGGPAASARLVIDSVKTSRRIVSISPIDSRKIEYELHSTVVFDYIVNGQPLVKNQRYSVSRFYSYNDSARLAAGEEQKDLARHMQEQLANRVLFRVKQAALHKRNQS